jgi:hypothetical protein
MRVRGFLKITKAGEVTFYKTATAHALETIVAPIALDIPDALFLPPVVPTIEITLDESIRGEIKALNEHVEGLMNAGIKVRFSDQ